MQVSIIVSVISLAGSLLTATLAFYSGLLNPLFASATNYAFNNIKRRLNAIAVFKKHRTPLLHATLDLRSRLLSICDQSWISTINKDSPAFDKEFVVHHSCFLIGQYVVAVLLPYTFLFQTTPGTLLGALSYDLSRSSSIPQTPPQCTKRSQMQS
jgi:hypothetical protein